MDTTAPFMVTLAISVVTWCLTARAVAAHLPGADGRQAAAIATVGSTALTFPAEWLADMAFAHPFATGWILIGSGLALTGACAVAGLARST